MGSVDEEYLLTKQGMGIVSGSCQLATETAMVSKRGFVCQGVLVGV